jgi:hypothetical protein
MRNIGPPKAAIHLGTSMCDSELDGWRMGRPIRSFWVIPLGLAVSLTNSQPQSLPQLGFLLGPQKSWLLAKWSGFRLPP